MDYFIGLFFLYFMTVPIHLKWMKYLSQDIEFLIFVLLIKFIHGFGNLSSYSNPCYIKRIGGYRFSSFQLLNRVRLFATPWTAERQVYLSDTKSRRLLKLMSIESVMSSNYLILCHLLLLASVFSNIRVFSSESVLHIRWPEYWSFSFSKSPSSEYSGLISFRMDWLDLLAVQGTLRSLLQHRSSKASVLWLNFPYSPALTSVHDYWKNHSFD